MQGSPAQVPPLHPKGHATSVDTYVHAPPAQLPLEKTRRVLASMQCAAGGVAHVTPAHGSPMQAPSAHPNAQVRSLGA